MSEEHAKIAVGHTGDHVETGIQSAFACDLLNLLTVYKWLSSTALEKLWMPTGEKQSSGNTADSTAAASRPHVVHGCQFRRVHFGLC